VYVALVTEDGEELERVDRIERVWDIMPSPQDSTFAVLCEIDEYGDTTFNHLQLPRLLEEWARLYERTNEQTKLRSSRRYGFLQKSALLRLIGT
jgi:hypothetical protein